MVATAAPRQLTIAKALIVFPAIAVAISVGCSQVSGAQPQATPGKSTTTTVPRAKSATSDWPLASKVLERVTITRERSQGYSRSLFTHWVDADGDGCDTREEVLIAESTTPAQVDAFGCKVVEGDWFSPYEGANHTSPGELDIDHMVPLKEAWDSGAWNWSASQRRSFANDLSDARSLIAVTASQNRSKSDKDPSNWIPPRASYLCAYVANWVAIKAHWNLSMDQSEFGRIRNILTKTCPDTRVAPWGTAAPATKGQPSSVTQPKSQSPSTTSGSGARQVRPVRCSRSDSGQVGEYKGIPYVCSDRRANGQPYAPGYFFWRPA